ncbi:hypothetical protein [Tepidanaerobacter acetatoxydans]|jgi:hypothetical protein|uniref:hypothetical protein n=1 Tax=Tepidanaerobacter acetatoxydans TaxID=499229 RepID=UPI001BD4A400|nr:hypothetical protein [Tepidanaerobacter acetatoxydans]
MKNNLIIMATITLFSIVAVLSCVIIGAMLLGKNSSTASTEGSSVAPEDDAPIGTPDTIAIPGYAQLVMKAGELLQDVELYNPEGNPCYFVITIALPDGTEIFKSSPIKAGQKTDVIKLSQPLKAGTYEGAVMKYSCFSELDDSPMNGANTKFTLEVVK